MSETDGAGFADLLSRQRRILQWMRDGNRIFEVLDKKYFTVYDDKANRDRRIKKVEVETLEGAGWIAAVPNPTCQRMDSWEITHAGTTLLSGGR